MFWNAGGFGYVIVLMTLGLQNLIWLVCDHKYQKSYWSGKEFQIFSQCWTTLPIWRVSNNLDLQHGHMFIFNPMIHVANTNLGIEFEHVNMLKIQCVWNSSDTFAFILPQQRTVFVSCHAQNFFSWSWAKKTLQGIINCSAHKKVIGVTKVANERYLPYLQFCRNAFLWISCIENVKVAQS